MKQLDHDMCRCALVLDPLASIPEARRGIEERLYGPTGPLIPPTREGDVPSLKDSWFLRETINWPSISPDGTKCLPITHCGISWDMGDILRFLQKCVWSRFTDGGWCLIYQGARSRGKGNKAWYGTFWTKGKSVRAHKFFAVAVLGLRPRPNREDELDHDCFNTRCVSCMVVKTHAENQKRIRRRKDYDITA